MFHASLSCLDNFNCHLALHEQPTLGGPVSKALGPGRSWPVQERRAHISCLQSSCTSHTPNCFYRPMRHRFPSPLTLQFAPVPLKARVTCRVRNSLPTVPLWPEISTKPDKWDEKITSSTRRPPSYYYLAPRSIRDTLAHTSIPTCVPKSQPQHTYGFLRAKWKPFRTLETVDTRPVCVGSGCACRYVQPWKMPL